MNYYEDFVRTHGHAPTYEELKDLVDELTQRPQRERQEQEKWEQIQEKQWWPGDPKEIEEPEDLELDETEEPDPKPVKTCHHLRENGQYCLSIAVSDREFCAYHLHHRGRRLKMARARAHHQRWRLQLPPLEDLYAVQVGIDRVLDALLHEQLDRHVGGLVLYGLQQAATNLGRPQEVWEQSSRFECREQLALPGFEAEFGLPPGFDLDTPPEVAFPETPAQRAAEGATGAVSEERASLMEVTPLDVELMELQQREGPEAVAEEKAAAANPASSSRAAGAPSLSASVADRVGAGPAIRKEPQPAATAASEAESLSGSAAVGSGNVKPK